MTQQNGTGLFAEPRPETGIGDERSSIVSIASPGPASPTPTPLSILLPVGPVGRPLQVVDAGARPTGGAGRDGQQDIGTQTDVQPMSPDLAGMHQATPTSPPPDLSDYARMMLQHTKQQMDASSGSTLPPAHIHVAGPVGQRQDRFYRRHERGASSFTNGTAPTMPSGMPPSRGSH